MKSRPWKRSATLRALRRGSGCSVIGVGRAWLTPCQAKKHERRPVFGTPLAIDALATPLSFDLALELRQDAADVAGMLNDVLERKAPRVTECARHLIGPVEAHDLRAGELLALL